MSSKSDRKAIALIAIIQGIASAMEGNKLVQPKIDAVFESARNAMTVYSEYKMTDKQFERATKDLSKLLDSQFNGLQDVRKLFSFWQMVLIDMLAFLKNEQKKKVITDLSLAIHELVKYYGKWEETESDEMVYAEGASVAEAFMEG